MVLDSGIAYFLAMGIGKGLFLSLLLVLGFSMFFFVFLEFTKVYSYKVKMVKVVIRSITSTVSGSTLSQDVVLGTGPCPPGSGL